MNRLYYDLLIQDARNRKNIDTLICIHLMVTFSVDELYLVFIKDQNIPHRLYSLGKLIPFDVTRCTDSLKQNKTCTNKPDHLDNIFVEYFQ